jgi:hypothetical protein
VQALAPTDTPSPALYAQLHALIDQGVAQEGQPGTLLGVGAAAGLGASQAPASLLRCSGRSVSCLTGATTTAGGGRPRPARTAGRSQVTGVCGAADTRQQQRQKRCRQDGGNADDQGADDDVIADADDGEVSQGQAWPPRASRGGKGLKGESANGTGRGKVGRGVAGGLRAAVGQLHMLLQPAGWGGKQ